MIIRDVLYGEFELPSFLDRFVMSPEFRRLSEVRLLNINSASLAALADVRRYSHTLGALRLALTNPMIDFDKDEYRALLASIIVHDAGTPAFAHLFEYFLSDRFNWDHESVVPLLLRGEHHTDKHANQIYYSQIPQFEKLCSKSKIDFELVLAILEGRHPGSKFIFGTLDFDNIDNVARMNWMLGHRFDIDRFISLSAALGVKRDAPLLLKEEQRANVEFWASLRRKAYDVLVFDGPTVAGQAVLSRAIADALDDKTLSVIDWQYSDADLIRTIREHSGKGKLRLEKNFFGALPNLLLLWHVTDLMHPLMDMHRDAIAEAIEEFLGQRLNVRNPYGYSLRDRGTFEKRIDAVDPETGVSWHVGERSSSLVVYGGLAPV